MLKSQTHNFIHDETESETLLSDVDVDQFNNSKNKNDNFLKYFENLKNELDNSSNIDDYCPDKE